MDRAFRYRLYPTPEQDRLLRRTIGCVRLVFNRALAERTAAWYERQQRIDYPASSALLTHWKKQDDLAFLGEVSSVPLQQCLRHLQKAVQPLLGRKGKVPQLQEKAQWRQC